MPFDLSSLGFFDSDIYNTVLRDILGVRPTGDAVADSVYLLVLPLLTLYLFSEHVSQLLHAGKTRLKWVFMAIVFFFIVQRGYYPIVADYSLFAFIILLIWGVWTFITGSGKAEQGGGGAQQTAHMGVYNMGVPSDRGGPWEDTKTVVGSAFRKSSGYDSILGDPARMQRWKDIDPVRAAALRELAEKEGQEGKKSFWKRWGSAS